MLIMAKVPKPGLLTLLVKNKFHTTKSTASATKENKLMARLIPKRGSSQLSSGSGLEFFLATRLLQLLGKLRKAQA